MALTTPADRPEVRRSNLLHLFSEYVAQRMADAPSEQINGLDREFAALIQVHNTYFSGMKSGARTIGDKLARQIETLCAKEKGWLDEPHEVFRPAELTKFLQLAEKAFLGAPAARKDLTRALRDALKPQSPISSK
jgi:hypothetical protein